MPSPAKAPPAGPGWIHEIKHDGFRIPARRDAAGVKVAGLALIVFLLGTISSNAITVEFLQAAIHPDNVRWLSGIACRNFDHIVHLDISVSWPHGSLDEETTGYGRLIFWDQTDEYLFPKGSYFILHSSYIIKGYFIARSGGTHQGISSNAFEKVDDAQVMLSPGPVERKMASGSCKQ